MESLNKIMFSFFSKVNSCRYIVFLESLVSPDKLSALIHQPHVILCPKDSKTFSGNNLRPIHIYDI